MQPGDMVRHRDRVDTDPRPEDVGENGRWGTYGVVVEVRSSPWPPDGAIKPSALYIDDDGNFILSKMEDLEVVSESR